jgi:hypothetical protein
MKSLLLVITENFLAPQFLQIGQERKGFDMSSHTANFVQLSLYIWILSIFTGSFTLSFK